MSLSSRWISCRTASCGRVVFARLSREFFEKVRQQTRRKTLRCRRHRDECAVFDVTQVALAGHSAGDTTRTTGGKAQRSPAVVSCEGFTPARSVTECCRLAQGRRGDGKGTLTHMHGAAVLLSSRAYCTQDPRLSNNQLFFCRVL